MYIDYLTLTGLLLVLPYIVMLVMFGKKKSTSRHAGALVFDCLDNESYRYGT
jgi:hypothetical protein